MKNTKIFKISVAAVVVAIIGMYMVLDNVDGRAGELMAFMAVGDAFEFDATSGTLFHVPGTRSAGRGYFAVGREGISFRNEDGVVQMQASFSMLNPMIFGAGDIVGVVEQGGFEIYLFNTEGLLYHRLFRNPILNFAVNEQGFSSVITKRGDVYESFLFNRAGQLVLENHESRHLVISTAISPDGRIWALAFLDITSGAQPNSHIILRYISHDEGIRHTDSIFATINSDGIPELRNQFFGIMRFLDGNNLIVLTERTIFCISMTQPSRIRWSVPLYNEIDAVAFHGSHIALAKGRGMLNMPAEQIGRVVLYNLNGERVWYADTGGRERVRSLSMSSHGVIVGVSQSFTAYSLRGAELWSFTAEYDARGAVFVDAEDRILLHTSNRATVMRRVRARGAAHS